MNHGVYIPNDYEQMLIAAGWITIESCDDEYLDYLKAVSFDTDGPMGYQVWQSNRQVWNRLNESYEREFPDPSAHLSFQQERRQRDLLREMGTIEVYLGY